MTDAFNADGCDANGFAKIAAELNAIAEGDANVVRFIVSLTHRAKTSQMPGEPFLLTSDDHGVFHLDALYWNCFLVGCGSYMPFETLAIAVDYLTQVYSVRLFAASPLGTQAHRGTRPLGAP